MCRGQREVIQTTGWNMWVCGSRFKCFLADWTLHSGHSLVFELMTPQLRATGGNKLTLCARECHFLVFPFHVPLQVVLGDCPVGALVT